MQKWSKKLGGWFIYVSVVFYRISLRKYGGRLVYTVIKYWNLSVCKYNFWIGNLVNSICMLYLFELLWNWRFLIDLWIISDFDEVNVMWAFEYATSRRNTYIKFNKLFIYRHWSRFYWNRVLNNFREKIASKLLWYTQKYIYNSDTFLFS